MEITINTKEEGLVTTILHLGDSSVKLNDGKLEISIYATVDKTLIILKLTKRDIDFLKEKIRGTTPQTPL